MTTPVRIPPLPGESLTGYLQRFHDAGMGPIRLHVSGRFDNATAPGSMIGTVSEVTGLRPEQLRAMTMHRWSTILRGRGDQRRHGWKLHRDHWWICPQCTPKTGYQSLRWRLALQPVCLRCRTYLIDPENPQIPRQVPDETVQVVQTYDRLLNDALAGARHRHEQLSVLRRICQRLAQGAHASSRQSLLPGSYHRSPWGTQWGPYPCPDPIETARLLTLTSSVSTRPTPARRFLRQLNAALQGVSETATPVTPDTPDTPPPSLVRARHRSTVAGLAERMQTTGLHPRHIPTVAAPSARGLARRLSLVGQTGTAMALHLLLAEASGERPSLAAARTFHGLDPSPIDQSLLNCVAARQGLDKEQQRTLLTAADDLIGAGLIDYRFRRGMFQAHPHSPQLPVPADWLPDGEEFSAHQLTRAWIWMHVAHGHPQAGPIPSVRLDEIDDFDDLLDEETRMHLYEHAAAQIDGPDLLSITTGEANHRLPSTNASKQRAVA